jgi:hypothetical protein
MRGATQDLLRMQRASRIAKAAAAVVTDPMLRDITYERVYEHVLRTEKESTNGRTP